MSKYSTISECRQVVWHLLWEQDIESSIPSIPTMFTKLCYIVGMEKDLLIISVESGSTLKQISKDFNTSQSNVRYWLKKFNLKLKRGARGKKPKDFSFPRKCNCGETDPNKFYGNKTTVCSKCHCQQTLLKGQENRIYILSKLGNKCLNCGFDKWKSSLDVHHLDPSQKDIAFQSIRYWARERIDKEIVKCILLCKNCHNAHHSRELINPQLSEETD